MYTSIYIYYTHVHTWEVGRADIHDLSDPGMHADADEELVDADQPQ